MPRNTHATMKTTSAPDGRRVTAFVSDLDIIASYGMPAMGVWVNNVGGGDIVWRAHNSDTDVLMTAPASGWLLPIQPGKIRSAASGTTVTDITLLFPEVITAV